MPNRRSIAASLLALFVLGLMAPACGRDPLEEARQLQAQGSFDASVALLAEVVQERHDDPEAHYLYGLALMRTGRPSEAAWPLRKAMESPEWIVRAGIQLGTGAVATGNADEAVEVLTRVLEHDPDNTTALLLRAAARIQTRRDYEGALADADRLLEIAPDNREILPQRALALLGLGREDEAAEALETLERSANDGVIPGPTAGGYCGARAKFAEESGEVEEAERLYRSCLEQFPANGVLLREAVAFFDALGKTEQATDAMRDALAVAPQTRDLRIALAVRLERLGDVESAEALLREATRDAQPLLAAGAHADLAGFLAQHGRLPEAIANYEQALELAPEVRRNLLFPFADTLVRAGETERALALADEIAVPGQRHLMRGRALLAKDETQAALEEFTRGLELWPNQPAARFYAGLAAERLGDFDRAIEEYRYAIRISSLLEARLRLARLHQALGEPRLGLVALRHDPEGSGLGVEPALLELELLASTSPNVRRMRPSLDVPQLQGRVLAALAAGTRRRAGPAAAARLVLSAQNLDPVAPAAAPALEGLVVDLCAAGREKQAIELFGGLRERAPERALLHALHAEALACAGDPDAARAANARALELEPALPRALWTQVRLQVERGELQAALETYERAEAATADDARTDSRALLAVAEALIEGGRRDEAIRRLDEGLARHPLDGEVALRLAALLAETPEGADRARALTRRAIRLGAGPEAVALADRLGEHTSPED